jgi:hypothetical protein
MCFSLAAFGTPLRINDPKCVAKTFPDYFERFADVTKAAPVIAIDGLLLPAKERWLPEWLLRWVLPIWIPVLYTG